jgi:hypothetical protein
MAYLALVGGLALPWLLGFTLLLALDWPRAAAHARAAKPNGGATALRLGYGYFAGAILLTLWMRALSAAGVPFGRVSIGAPLLLAIVALVVWAKRHKRISLAAGRHALALLLRPPPPRWQRWVWALLVAWLLLRFGSLAMEVAWRPLFPWDAWVQWATKARVWYELGRIAPFVPSTAWLSGDASAYFDAAPSYPATVPLLQVWSCIALGRWDDSAMNWPWLWMLLALTLAVCGALRDAGLPALGALIGAYFVASLPLLDAHVALAGYADLMMAGVYTLAALAFYRWTLHRDPRDGTLALLFALACPLINVPGLVWALTLVPGVIMALLPRHGLKLVSGALGVTTLVLLALAQFQPTLLGYRLHLDYQPPWQSLVQADFLFDNWHLLVYAVVALTLLGARRLATPPLAPLAAVVATALAFLFVVFAFPNAAASLADFTTVNRATLHLAPLLTCLYVLLWRELTTPARAIPPAAMETSALGAADA